MRTADLEFHIMKLRRIAMNKLLAQVKDSEPNAQGGESNVFFVELNGFKFALITPKKPREKREESAAPTPAIKRHAQKGEAVLDLAATPQRTRAVYPRFAGDLDSLPKELNSEQVKGIVGQIAAALARWHKQGVVHRDIKLGNLLCENRGEFYLVKFADLGNSIVVNPNTGKLILDGKSDINLAYTLCALPPKFRDLLNKKEPTPEASEEVAALSDHSATSEIASDDCTRVAITQASCLVHGGKGSAGFLSGASQDERENKLHVKLRDANYLQLDTHAFYEMLLKLREKIPGEAEQLDDLISRLESGAYPDEGAAAFTMQDVIAHPFFGENVQDREAFFNDLKERANAVDSKMPRDILPQEVTAIIASIKDRQFDQARHGIESLKPSKQMYKQTLRAMLADARSTPGFSVVENLTGEFNSNLHYGNLEAAVSTVVGNLTSENQRTDCYATLFAINSEVTSKKIAIIQAVMAKLKDKNYKHLESFFIEPVEIKDGEKTIRLSLCQALCLKRDKFSRGRWIKSDDYSYHGNTASFDAVVNTLGNSVNLSAIKALVNSKKNAPESISSLNLTMGKK